ncbi:hypothetical protein [Sorangium sp. So ce1151]|uniref:hypothetical protein n=1 Tax=Sorangium sp. So ce1151 TaxID=3133332 RepID=UPI003F6046AA
MMGHHAGGVRERSIPRRTAWSMDGKNFARSSRSTHAYRRASSAAARRHRCVPNPLRHA